MGDLWALPETEREDEAQRLAQEEVHKPFDLAQGPLLRVRLLRLGEQEHLLFVAMHHIISDGWSLGVLAHELAVLYDGFALEARRPWQSCPFNTGTLPIGSANGNTVRRGKPSLPTGSSSCMAPCPCWRSPWTVPGQQP